MRRWLGLLLVLMTGPARAGALGELLDAVDRAARFEPPARADVRIERDGRSSRAVLLGSRRTVYVETATGFRALVKPGKVLMAERGRAVRAPVGTPIPDTDLLLEDLVPFTATTLKVPQMSDDGPGGAVVVGAPAAASAYVLLAVTIDRDRLVLTRRQYYEETISNLAKMRRDGSFVELARSWRPGEIAVEQTRRGTSTRLTLDWKLAAELPTGLFTPRGLRVLFGIQ